MRVIYRTLYANFYGNSMTEFCVNLIRDLSEISRGEGVETEGGLQLFETAEKGGVMKNGPLKGGGSCKYVSVIM